MALSSNNLILSASTNQQSSSEEFSIQMKDVHVSMSDLRVSFWKPTWANGMSVFLFLFRELNLKETFYHKSFGKKLEMIMTNWNI